MQNNTIEFTNLNNLTVFENFGYGDYKCSCCGNVLHGVHTCVGDYDNDDNGYEWRSFCNDCKNVINTNDLQSTFLNYNEAECAD